MEPTTKETRTRPILMVRIPTEMSVIVVIWGATCTSTRVRTCSCTHLLRPRNKDSIRFTRRIKETAPMFQRRLVNTTIESSDWFKRAKPRGRPLKRHVTFVESQSCTLFQLLVSKAQSFDFEDLLVKRTWSDPELYRRTEAVFCRKMDLFDRSLTRTCNGMSWAVWIFECSALNFFIDCNPYSVENKGIENRSNGDFDRAWKARLRGDHEGFSGKPPPPPPMESHPSPGQSTREMRSLQINQCCCWSNTIIKTN